VDMHTYIYMRGVTSVAGTANPSRPTLIVVGFMLLKF